MSRLRFGFILVGLIGLALVIGTAGGALSLFLWAIGCRLAYLAYVGVSLRRAAALDDVEENARRFDRFRPMAWLLMTNDAVAIGLLALATRNTIDVPLLPAVLIGGGLGLLGTGCKIWAGRTLGRAGWLWQDFFIPPTASEARWDGLYRFLDNPMYTVGYIQAWALPLMVRSGFGVLAGLFAHASILAFWWFVERGHMRSHYTRESPAPAHPHPPVALQSKATPPLQAGEVRRLRDSTVIR